MKKLLVILFVLSSVFAKSQLITQYLGTPKSVVSVRGWIKPDSGLVIPNLDTTTAPNFLGEVRYKTSDSTVYIGISISDSQKWMKLRGYVPAGAGTGTVQSVGASFGGSVVSVSGTPVTGTGTLAFTWNGAGTDVVLGNGSYTPFSTAITNVTDALYSPIGHSHVAADISDFTSAVRSSFSAGTGITITDGVIAWNGSASGITSLNGLTGTTQTFAFDTTGNKFEIVSTGTQHTWKIPARILNTSDASSIDLYTQIKQGAESNELFTLPNGVNEFDLHYVGSNYYLFYDNKTSTYCRVASTIDGLASASDVLVSSGGRYPTALWDGTNWNLWTWNQASSQTNHYISTTIAGLASASINDFLTNMADLHVRQIAAGSYIAGYKDLSTLSIHILTSTSLNGGWVDHGEAFAKTDWYNTEEADPAPFVYHGKLYCSFAGFDGTIQRLGVIQINSSTYVSSDTAAIILTPHLAWQERNSMTRIFNPVYFDEDGQSRFFYSQNPNSSGIETGWGYVEVDSAKFGRFYEYANGVKNGEIYHGNLKHYFYISDTAISTIGGAQLSINNNTAGNLLAANGGTSSVDGLSNLNYTGGILTATGDADGSLNAPLQIKSTAGATYGTALNIDATASGGKRYAWYAANDGSFKFYNVSNGNYVWSVDANDKINFPLNQNWDASVQGTGVGGLHLGSSMSDNYGNSITFGAAGQTNAQAGIYTKTSNAYGTRMYLSTTNSFSTGAQTAVAIDEAGGVTIPRTLAGTGNRLVYADASGKLVASTLDPSAIEGSPNSNIGSGYRWAIPNTNNIKTVFGINGVLIDSSTNSNALTFQVDSSKYATQYYVDSHTSTPTLQEVLTSGSVLTGSNTTTTNSDFTLSNNGGTTSLTAFNSSYSNYVSVYPTDVSLKSQNLSNNRTTLFQIEPEFGQFYTVNDDGSQKWGFETDFGYAEMRGILFIGATPYEHYIKVERTKITLGQQNNGNTTVIINDIPVYTDNAAATAGGLSAGSLYRSGDQLMIVH